MRNNLDKPVEYIENTPINMGVYEIEYCPIHLHQDIEIAYVLKGSLLLKFSVDEVQLNEGDLYIINSNILHEIKGLTEDHQILLMRIDISKYMEANKYFNRMTFHSQVASKTTIENIQESLMKVYRLRNSKAESKSQIIKLADDIISTLVEEFQLPSHSDDRYKLLDFIYNNYQKNITFDDLAKSTDIDKDYLSKISKNMPGPDFTTLLDAIRIEESEKTLLGTELSIEKIATTHGFTSPSKYIEKFEKILGYTPSVYRKEMVPFTIDKMDVIGRELHI